MIGSVAASCPAPYASSRPFQGIGASIATNIMAKQAQSSSQLSVPQKTIQPICVQLSRTAVIQAMIRSICAVVSPRGRSRQRDRHAQHARHHRVQRALVDEERADADHDHERADEHGHQVERGALVGREAQAEDGHQRQADRGRDERAGQGPDGERVVGAEAAEPAEAVDRGDGVPDGQRVRDRLRRERQLEQRPPRAARRCPALSSSYCMAAKHDVRGDLGHDGRRAPTTSRTS